MWLDRFTVNPEIYQILVLLNDSLFIHVTSKKKSWKRITIRKAGKYIGKSLSGKYSSKRKQIQLVGYQRMIRRAYQNNHPILPIINIIHTNYTE